CRKLLYSLPNRAPNEEDEEILARVGLGPAASAISFYKWTFKPNAPPRPPLTQLLRLAKRWLQPDQTSSEGVVERVVAHHFLHTLPSELQTAVGLQGAPTMRGMVEATESAQTILSMARPIEKRSPGPFPTQKDRPLFSGVPLNPTRGPRPGFRPKEPPLGPIDEPMNTAPESPHRPAPAAKAWLAGCGLHTGLARPIPRCTLQLNGRRVQAILDSGSTVTLARPEAIPWVRADYTTIKVRCVHGDQKTVRTAKVSLGRPSSSGPSPLASSLIFPSPSSSAGITRSLRKT
uniref:SCAN box domain-containing protein n=1 Tax=Astyanax mexicanus TaxID=7994 RepID=A0A3B1JMD0_ASTMX